MLAQSPTEKAEPSAKPGKILDVGCGSNKKEGAVGIDRVKLPGVDVVHNIDQFPWPFESGTFDGIIMSQVVEHVENVLKTMEEVHRVGRPGCVVKIYTPHFSSFNSWTDPTHRWHLAYRSFDLFCENRNYVYTPVQFKLLSRNFTFGKGLLCLPGRFISALSPEIYEKYFCYLFPAKDIEFSLQIEKPE